MTNIVVVSAGLSVPSSTRILADSLGSATQRALSALGQESEIEVIELRDLAHLITDNQLTGFPTGTLSEAVRRVAEADAVIAVTPVFSACYSGLFKSFFDVLEDGTLEGKPVLVAATAGTARHSLVLDFAMRPLFAYLRADVVPTGVFAASSDFGSGATVSGARCRPGSTAPPASWPTRSSVAAPSSPTTRSPTPRRSRTCSTASPDRSGPGSSTSSHAHHEHHHDVTLDASKALQRPGSVGIAGSPAIPTGADRNLIRTG